MSDTFAYCGCQYEPDQAFQDAHWKDVKGVLTCDVCGYEIKWQDVEYNLPDV